MQADLITTAQAAQMLGVSVASVNRWAADPEHSLKPAHQLPGETGARLYNRSDVEALAKAGAA